MIWAIPRSKSTILLKVLSNHSEIKAIFEPFCFAFFTKIYENTFTFESIREAMSKEPFTNDNIVWKDVADCVENQDFEKWITDKSFKHVLLIRDPIEVAMSTVGYKGQPVRFMNWPTYYPVHPTIEDSFQVMVKLRDYLHKNGFDYKVFDSQALNPTTGLEFVKSICEFGQIPFDKTMLDLKSTDSFPETWWRPSTAHLLADSSGLDLDFHGNACKSTSLEPVRTIAHDTGKDLTEDEIMKLENIRANVIPLYHNLRMAVQ